MLGLGGADDRGGDPGLLGEPGEGDLGAGTPRAAAIAATCSMTLRSVSSSRKELCRMGRCSSARFPSSIAREPPSGERAPWHHGDACIGAERQHLSLLFPVEEVVEILHADEGRPPVLARQCDALLNCQANMEEAPR